MNTEPDLFDDFAEFAAAWIQVSGKRIYDYVCENERDFEVQYDVNEPLPILGWQDPGVWTMARWVFWKERFGVMAGRTELAEETRKTADAAKYMEEIENAKMK